MEPESGPRLAGVRASRDYTSRVNRRTFLATPLIPLMPRLALRRGPATTAPSTFDPWIEINAANLRHNAGEVARVTTGPVLAVIKNNGYGLGVVHSANALEPHPSVYGFAVVKLQEALDLRQAGHQETDPADGAVRRARRAARRLARHHADGLHADRRRARARKPAARAGHSDPYLHRHRPRARRCTVPGSRRADSRSRGRGRASPSRAR